MLTGQVTGESTVVVRCCTQARLCVPEVGVQRTLLDESRTPPYVCPSTASRTTMLTTDDTMDVDNCDRHEKQYGSELAWTLAADEITVVND